MQKIQIFFFSEKWGVQGRSEFKCSLGSSVLEDAWRHRFLVSWQPVGWSCGWRGERVQHPVGESGGAGTEAPVPPPTGQEAEQIVRGVAWITPNCDCFAGEVGGVYVPQGGEWSTNDLPVCVHYALQGSPVVVRAASAPHSDTPGEDALSVPL